MINNIISMDKYYELQEETIDFFKNIFNQKAFPINLDFVFVGNSKQKGLIKLSKVPDHFEFLMNKNLLIFINEELFDAFDDECRKILFEQEIDKLTVDIEKGKIKMIKPDLSTFSGIVNKFGIAAVTRANGVNLLATEQMEDANSENII